MKWSIFGAGLLVFFVLPGPRQDYLDGFPLHPYEVPLVIFWVLLFLVIPSTTVRERPRGRGILATLLILGLLKCLFYWAAPEQGLMERIYSVGDGDTKIGLSNPANLESESISKEIDFRSEGSDGIRNRIELGFLNNKRKFQKWDLQGNQDRTKFQFFAEWSGYLFAPQTGMYLFSFESDQPVSLKIDDGQLIAAIDELEVKSNLDKEVFLSKGFHKIQASYFHGHTSAHGLTLLWKIPGSRMAVVDSGYFFLNVPSSFGGGLMEFFRGLRWVLYVGLLLTFLISSVSILRGSTSADPLKLTGVLFFVFLLGYVDVAVSLSRGNHPGLTGQVLSRGDDWLAYETQAINVLRGNYHTDLPGTPFYYMPLYRYFIAGFHILLGPGPLAVLLCQGMVYGLVLMFLYLYLSRGIRSSLLGLFGTVLFWYSGIAQLDVIRILPTVCAMLLFLGMLYCLQEYTSENSRWVHLVLGGILLGLSMGIRAELQAILVLSLFGFLILHRSRISIAFKHYLIFIAFALLAISPITIYNYSVSRSLILVSESPHKSFPLDLPSEVQVSQPLPDRWVYRSIPFSRPFFPYVEYIAQRPDLFLSEVIFRRALFVVGLGRGKEGEFVLLNRGHFIFSVLAFFGFLFVALFSWRKLPVFPSLIFPFYFFLFTFMGGFTYGWRLLVPFYPIYLLFILLAFALLVRSLMDRYRFFVDSASGALVRFRFQSF